MTWNPKILDERVAPQISKFTSAAIPDLSPKFPQADYWLANHFLNSVLGATFVTPYRQIVLGLIRRAQTSFCCVHRARSITLEYLSAGTPLNPPLRKYYAAISEWERFALEVQMATDLYNYIADDQKAFKTGDKSKEERISTIANQVKHTANCIRRGIVDDVHSVPVWLTNDGINSFRNTRVTYNEASEILQDLSHTAEELQDPHRFRLPRMGQKKPPPGS